MTKWWFIKKPPNEKKVHSFTWMKRFQIPYGTHYKKIDIDQDLYIRTFRACKMLAVVKVCLKNTAGNLIPRWKMLN